MSMKMGVDAYKELIEGNMKWLGKQPSSCERSHIMGIVKDSTNYYYPENYKKEIEQLQKDNDTLKKSNKVLAEALNELLTLASMPDYHWEEEDYTKLGTIRDIANKQVVKDE